MVRMRDRKPPALDPGLDHRLVERCLAGDARAWEILVRRHERLVFAVARSYRLSDEDLGDVFQEVFTALVRGIPRLRDGRALVRWLSSTTERMARATALRRRREAALALSGERADAAALPSADSPVGADLELLEERALVRLAFDALPARCRELLHALFYEDPAPSYAALSRRLRVPVGSLGPTRARCFERLREAYGRLRADEPGITTASGLTSSDESDPRQTRSGVERLRIVEGPA
jgi:RNA polymerase sigma factor (sigma-70 family)